MRVAAGGCLPLFVKALKMGQKDGGEHVSIQKRRRRLVGLQVVARACLGPGPTLDVFKHALVDLVLDQDAGVKIDQAHLQLLVLHASHDVAGVKVKVDNAGLVRCQHGFTHSIQPQHEVVLIRRQTHNVALLHEVLEQQPALCEYRGAVGVLLVCKAGHREGVKIIASLNTSLSSFYLPISLSLSLNSHPRSTMHRAAVFLCRVAVALCSSELYGKDWRERALSAVTLPGARSRSTRHFTPFNNDR